MNCKKIWLLRFFFVLFVMSISTAVLPGGTINAHGLFGEITASVVVEEEAEQTEEIRAQTKRAVVKQKHEIHNVIQAAAINLWFVLLVLVICLRFREYPIRLPRRDTIVTWKVRMDD